MVSETDEELFEWICWRCAGDLGTHPRGIRVECPICKAENILPGINIASKKQSARIKEIQQRARKDTLLRYHAMREH